MATKYYYEHNKIQTTAELSPEVLEQQLEMYTSSSLDSNAVDAVANSVSADAYEPDDTASNATRITPGTTQTHSLTAGDFDMVYFTVTTAGTYTIETTGSGDTVMGLFDSNGELIEMNDDISSSNRNARISRTLSAGTYFVGVMSYDETVTISSYGITLTAPSGSGSGSGDMYEPDDEPNYASQITAGSTQTHSLTAGDTDWVYFTVTTAGTYTIETTGSGDTKMTLYQLNGQSLTQLATNDDISSSNRNARISRSLSSGTYFANVTAYSSSTAISSYGIKLTASSGSGSTTTISADSYEGDNSRFTARTIAVGATQNRSIHSASDVDWVKFTVSSDGYYSLITSGADTVLELYTMEGQYVGKNDDRGNGNYGSQAIAQLYANTSYFARISPNGNKTFNYTLSLTQGVVADSFESNNDNTKTGTSTTLTVGQSQGHTIHTASDVDWMKFTITSGGTYAITAAGTEREDAKLKLEVYNPAGSLLTSTTGNEPCYVAGLVSGTYYVKVSSASGVAAGGYAIAVSGNDLNDIRYDSYETDDTVEQAKTLTMSASQTTVSQTRSLTPYSMGDEIMADHDWILFEPTVTGLYSFQVSGTTAISDLDVYSYSSDDGIFMPVANSSGINPYVENYLIAGNSYYIDISSMYSMLYIPNYTFTATRKESYTGEQDAFEGDNSASTAKVLTLNTPQAHSIHSASDVDWMKFTPSTSGYYSFYTGARNGNAGDADMLLALYDAEGKLLLYDDDGFAGYNSMISYNLSAGNTYYLLAKAAVQNQTIPYYTVSATSGVVEDTYDIYMDERSVTDDTMANGTLIELGKTQSHSIHTSSDVDWVWFYVGTSGTYTIKTEGTGDTIMELYGDTGSFLTIDDDSGVGNNASITYQLQANRFYNAKITAYRGSLIPSYTVSLTKATGGSGDAYESDNTSATAKAILAGDSQSHSIHAAGDVDWVKFRPIQSGSYQIQTSGDGDLKLDLYAANGTTLLASDDDSGVGLNARIGYNLNANTDYYIKAYTYDSNVLIDEYALGVSLLVDSELGDEYENDNNPTNAKAISVGQTQTHSIHTAGDVDWVTFTPTVSAEYTIQTVGSGLNCDTQLYLYTSLANAQANSYLQWDDDSGSDRNALISRVLTAGTTYYIKAKAWETYTIPSYGLKVTQNNGSGSASSINGDEYENDNASGVCKPIAVGREYTHSIHVQSDTDWVRFFTHQTGTYTIQTTGDSDMSFIVYKREPGGPLVPYENGETINYGGAADNALYRVKLETNNWYYVRITTRNRATTTSSYGIRVDIDSSSVSGDQYEKMGGKANDNAPSRANWLTLGYSQMHSIHTPGDNDWVAYKADTNSSIIITAENEESKLMRLYAYRLNDDGSLTYLKESMLGSYGITSTTLDTEAGNIYYVRAQAVSSTQTINSYSLVATYVKDQYEDDNTSSKATSLVLGTSQTHNIHTRTDEDWYKLTVASAGTYEFETAGNGDTYGILYRSNNGSNSVVTQSGTGGTGANMKISRYLSAGTYYLRVTGENGGLVDSYSVVARRPITEYDEPNNSKSYATALGINATKTGSFHTTSDVDYFKISASSSGTYKLVTNSSAIAIELTAGSQTITGMGSAAITLTAGATIYAKLQNTNGELMDSYTAKAEYTAPAVTNRAENYVVLFAGGGVLEDNHVRYYFNFYDTYNFLVENYGIPKDHIYVLYADGSNTAADTIFRGELANSDMSFANGSHVYEATKEKLQSVMNELARKTDSNDHLLVYVYDHGTDLYDGDTASRGYEYIVPHFDNPQNPRLSECISGAEFNSMVQDIKAGYQTYLFAQCYSGGILDALNMNRTGIKMYGAASDTHYDVASSWVDADGVAVGGFAFETARALYKEVQNTYDFNEYLIDANYSKEEGVDQPYAKGANFQIFAQA